MDRKDFMGRLEGLLQNISASEREEALQYYNDYFDDAGPENEQKVIADLGTPARVAENIRRELTEGQSAKRPTAADEALIEYGKAAADGPGQEADPAAGEVWDEYQASRQGRPGGDPGGTAGSSGDSNCGGATDSGGSAGTSGKSGGSGRPGMSGGTVALIVILALIASPILVPLAMGLLCVVFGILVALIAVIFAFGVTAAALFLTFFVMLIVGGMCMSIDPLAGVAVIGGGLICGGMGILFLMLTVALTGIVIPAFFRGIGHLFRLGRREVRR